MLVTKIRVRRVPHGGGLVGSVDLIFSKMLVVRNIKIIKNTNLEGNEFFIGMPRILVKDRLLETVASVSREVRDSLERLIFAAFTYLQENSYHRAIFDYDQTKNKTSLLEQEFIDFFVESYDLLTDS